MTHSESISVGDYTAALLVRDRGAARHRIASQLDLSDVELFPQTAGNGAP